MTITETIRAAAIASGQTQMQIATATGIPQSRISEFLRGGTVKSAHLDKLASHFGIVAKQTKRQPRLEGKLE